MHLPRPLPGFSLSPVLLLLLLAACGSPFSDAPPVADSTLVGVLAELHLAEARLRGQAQRRDSVAAERGESPESRVTRSSTDTARVPVPADLRDSILVRHGLTSRQLRTAIDYYVRHPEAYTELYRRIADTLNAEYRALRLDGREPQPGDTLRTARPVPEAFR